VRKLLFEILGLQTPRGRLLFFALVSLLIFLTPYEVLANFSIWHKIGFESAPSIGLTRAYWHILHLDIEAAYKVNRLIFIVMAIGVPILMHDAWQQLTKPTK
jgi:hypothetical protein